VGVVGVWRDGVATRLYQPIILNARQRGGGQSPFRTPSAVAASVATAAEDGLQPPRPSGEWWDTDFPALLLSEDLAAVDSPAALSLEDWPPSTALFREGEAVVVYASSLPSRISVVLAETSEDTWYEAAEGSYEEYRDALARELEQRGVTVRIEAAWS